MKRIRLFLASTLLVLGCAPVQQPPEQRVPVKEYSIEEFLGTTAYTEASFSPDGSKILVSSDASGIFNLYAVPVDGGKQEQLTNSTVESLFAQAYFPGDERILYMADVGGNELDHIYLRDLDGSVTDLTPGEGLKALFLGWSPDDDFFYISTNERDQKFFDVYEYSVEDYDREMIFRNDQGLSFADISPDRSKIALQKTHTTTNTDTYLYDRETDELTLLTSHEGDVSHNPQAFTPDGQALLLTTNADSEFQYLVRHDLDSGDREVVEKVDWDITFADYSDGGKYLFVGVNNDARTELRVYETASGEQLSLPEISGATVSSVTFSPDESHMAFYASSSRIPSDLFVQRLDGSEPQQLTRSLNPAINAEDLVEAKVVRFKSWDGLEIPGILYMPRGASKERPAPALVSVHGGPGGQSRLNYRPVNQYLANHGYVVYAINNRGSSGYGKTFFHLDDTKHGVEDLDDCVASKKMMVETGYVDPERIGIIGGSYGGYMVLAALTFRPEEFAVGVDLFGISNWHRTLQNIPPWWESFRAALEAEMGPFDDEEFFKGKSPLFHAEKIARPLMVLQGANDPRVLKAESDDIVEAVRANGVPVEYMVFDDEGHGFLKKSNREKGYAGILAFLDEHLKGADQEEAGG